MNRLYYACFYAVLALFSKYKINSHTHSGAKTQLSLHFVKTGKLEKEFGMLYGDLFDLRQKGDYGDFFEFEEQHITHCQRNKEDVHNPEVWNRVNEEDIGVNPLNELSQKYKKKLKDYNKSKLCSNGRL